MAYGIGTVDAEFWYRVKPGFLQIFSHDPREHEALPVAAPTTVEDPGQALCDELSVLVGVPKNEYGLIKLHDLSTGEEILAGYDRRQTPCKVYLPTENTWSELEELVFQGEFSYGLKAVLWCQYGMDKIGVEGNSPEHARLQKLMALYSFRSSNVAEEKRARFKERGDKIEKEYKEKYSID